MTGNPNPRQYGDKRSYPIPVWNGIFDHRPRIGASVWVFLWCLDRVTREESGVGFVLGGTSVTAGRIAQEIHDSERTVRRHLDRLAEHGYVKLKRNSHGFLITVGNSCKFDIWRSDKNGRHDRTKVPVSSDKSARVTDKNVRPIKEDTAVDSAVDLKNQGEPHCYWCYDTGWKTSYATPGKRTACACRTEKAAS